MMRATQGRLDMGNLFRVLAHSLDNALSPLIMQGSPEDYREFVNESPKIKYVMECIRSVKEWHEGKGEEVSGQVIYMDVFVFRKPEEKTSRINNIWFKGDRGNVLDLENLNPEEIKLAFITDEDRLVKMFFDQEKEQMQREFNKVNRAIQMVSEIREDIEYYNRYREESITAIRNFYNTLVKSSFSRKTETDAAEPDP